MIRIPGNIDRIIENSRISLYKKKKIYSVVPISAVDNKFNNSNNNSNSKNDEFAEMLAEESEKRKKH